MIIAILAFLVLGLIIFALMWYFGSRIPDHDFIPDHTPEVQYPTIHSVCQTSTSCGGDLTCDASCHRCKKTLGGACASNVDCEQGLICHDWYCTASSSKYDPELTIPKHKNLEASESKHNSSKVHWADDKNQTYYI